MWSVRMRAEGKGGLHISGAEGIFPAREVEKALRAYAKRALSHPRGKPKTIHLSAERLPARPRPIKSLPVSTAICESTAEAMAIAKRLLVAGGVSERAIRAAINVMRGKTMRGAALIDSRTGKRLDPDRTRGVRVTRMGISKAALASLRQKLRRRGIDTSTVREALALASKAAYAKDVIAELCVSDDPGYTTGYVASRGLGYLRIPNIKRSGSAKGGRALFVRPGAVLRALVKYLEESPVVVAEISGVQGVVKV